jgi:hypothetical protein
MSHSVARVFAETLVVLGAAFAMTAEAIEAKRATPSPLRPGARIGPMRLERVDSGDNLVSIFNFCNPLIFAPGLIHRHCTIPGSHRLFVGWGDFESTYPALERVWRHERWRLRIDGHDIQLANFGTDDRTLYSYPPGSHANSILREWRIALINPSPGPHRIRYLVYRDHATVTDVTWTVTISARPDHSHKAGTGVWVIPSP